MRITKKKQNRRQQRQKKMRGGVANYVPYNSANDNGAPLDNTGRGIPFNTSTGELGVDPLAAVNITRSRLIPQMSGGKNRKTRRSNRRYKKSKSSMRRKMRGGLGWSSLDAIPDFFLGPRTEMNQVTAFGSTAGGTMHNHNQLTGQGNSDGPSLAPYMGPPVRAMA